MKKIALILVVCMLLGCAGCGGGSPESKAYRKNLKAVELEKTSAPVAIGQIPGVHLENLTENTLGVPLVQEMISRESNPIALFLEMVRQGAYEKIMEQEGFTIEDCYDHNGDLEDAFRMVPETEPMIPDGQDGYTTLLRKMLQLSALVEDDAPLESALLNQIENSDREIVAYSEADQCWYSYFVCYGGEYAYVLVMYFHENEVEIQSLFLASKIWGYAGCGTALWYAQSIWSMQNGGLICAVEELLAGESEIRKHIWESEKMYLYELPGSYQVGEWNVEISSAEYENQLIYGGDYYDNAILVNYRISR